MRGLFKNRLNGVKMIFRSFQYRNYRLFFGGQSISLIGTWIQRITTPWLVYHLTGSVLLLGVVGFAGQIPTLLIAPFAGVLTDRWNRYHILIATQITAMIQALALSFLFFAGVLEIWHIVLLNIFLGCINAFDVPARQSFVIDLVEKKEDLGNAIALNSSMFNGARLIGPSIAGILISMTGEGICFLLNGISYLFVIGSLLLMKVPKKEVKSKRAHVIEDLKNGFKYAFNYAPIKYIIFLLSLVSILGMQYTVLIPVFAKEILHGGSNTYGFLMGATGVGALTGALYLASRRNVIGLFKIIPLATGVFGLGLVALSFSRSFLLSLFLMSIVGFGMMLQMASSNTILQTIVDDDKRGRIMSIYTIAFMGTAPFGSILAGGMAKIMGVADTILIGGISCLLGALFFISKLPELNKKIHSTYIRLNLMPPQLVP